MNISYEQSAISSAFFDKCVSNQLAGDLASSRETSLIGATLNKLTFCAGAAAIL
jgi:hypothetical protein